MGRVIGLIFENKLENTESLKFNEINELAVEKGLDKLNMDQLRVLAVGKGLEITSKLKKDELISLITENEEEEGE